MNYFLTEEQQMMKDMAAQIAREKIKPVAIEFDEGQIFPSEIVKIMGESDLFRVFVPEEYGGFGGGIFEMCLVVEELSKECGGISLAYAASGLGTIPIILFGTEEQKKKYLPSLASGEMLAAFALTEAGAGSDAAAIQTTAKPDGDNFVLNGTKQWITNGGDASIYTVIALTDPTRGARGTSAILVEKGTPVDKICGPGSPYVSAAQRLLRDEVTVGLPAGPSESVILADREADAWRVGLDLLIEAEHGPDSSALLVTDSRELGQDVIEVISRLHRDLPAPRKEYVERVLLGYGGVILSADLEESISIVNQFAPEHLQIRALEPWAILPRITNAGEILLGEHTPFSLANYSAGPNAVLPTGGAARTWSPVSVRDFIKYSSVVYATKAGLRSLGPFVVSLAEYESFPSHARSITRRDGE